MKFDKALELLRENKRVRRKCWEEGHYWKSENWKIVNSIGETPIINVKQLQADDWEECSTIEPLKNKIGLDHKYSGNIFYSHVTAALYELKKWNEKSLTKIDAEKTNKKIDELWGDEITWLS